MTMEEFIGIHKNDFDTYDLRPDWNGYKVYGIWRKKDEGACVGYPKYALEKNGTIRESSLEEAIAIMQANLSADDE